jgi:hypothetical protein
VSVRRRHVRLPIPAGSSVFLRVGRISGTGEDWAGLEFNPSRVVDPGGWRVAGLPDVFFALEEVLAECRQLLMPKDSVETFLLTRIDVTRDFVVADPSVYICHLRNVARSGAPRVAVDFNASVPHALRVYYAKAGQILIYDKHLESKGKAPRGTLRWEARCRKRWCRRYGSLSTVRDMTSNRLFTLAQNRWEWSGMGTEVCSATHLAHRINELHYSSPKKSRLLGDLVMQSVGIDVPMSNDRRSELNQCMRELGIISPPTLTWQREEDLVRWLDFDSGREEIRRAS